MKKKIILKSMLMIALMCLPFIATSCDDDDESGTVYYSMGLDTVSSSDLSFLSEMSTIESAYMNALGVSSSTFTLNGTVSECDSVVKSACAVAETTLSSYTFTGSYTFSVYNANSEKTIYTYQIN